MSNAEHGQGGSQLAGKRVWVAGHRGMVGSALVRRLAREECEILTVARQELDLRRPGGGRALARRRAAGGRGGRRRQGRRHPRQRHQSGRVPLRQPDDRGERDRGRPSRSGSRSCCSSARAASIPGLAPQPMREEHLLDGPARADQPVVRRRQDRRPQAVPGLSPAVRVRLHQRHADQPLRPGRQLRS